MYCPTTINFIFRVNPNSVGFTCQRCSGVAILRVLLCPSIYALKRSATLHHYIVFWHLGNSKKQCKLTELHPVKQSLRMCSLVQCVSLKFKLTKIRVDSWGQQELVSLPWLPSQLWCQTSLSIFSRKIHGEQKILGNSEYKTEPLLPVHQSSYQRRQHSDWPRPWIPNGQHHHFSLYAGWYFRDSCRYTRIWWLPRRHYRHRHPWKNSWFLAGKVGVIIILCPFYS